LVGACNFWVSSAIVVADLAILLAGFLMDLRVNGWRFVRRADRDIRETLGERVMLYAGVSLIAILVLYWFGILSTLLSSLGCQ